MSGNKLELCTFAATMPRIPSKNKVVRVLFWANIETPGDVVKIVAAVVQVLSVQNTPTSQLKTIGGKKHGSNSENQNQVKGL